VEHTGHLSIDDSPERVSRSATHHRRRYVVVDGGWARIATRVQRFCNGSDHDWSGALATRDSPHREEGDAAKFGIT
jgi:hypothetical protein